MYIDVHCHLEMLKNLDEVLGNARARRVRMIVANGVNPSVNRKVLRLVEEYSEVRVCLGVYPTDALGMKMSEINSEIKFIRENSSAIVGIGEVGMDFSEAKEKVKQRKVFEKFVKLAMDLDVPITVHSRKAEKECVSVLEKMKAKKVIMHYFSGKMVLVDKIVGNGWYLSIPTAVKNSEHFKKVVERVNVDRLLCETDSPYSHPDKKFPNEPANVVESYKMIAKIKGVRLMDVERAVEENYWKLFGK